MDFKMPMLRNRKKGKTDFKRWFAHDIKQMAMLQQLSPGSYIQKRQSITKSHNPIGEQMI